MPHFNVEKGVKLEDHKRSTGVSKNQDIIDALAKLEVGDSFTMPYGRKSSYESVRAMFNKQGRMTDKRFASRKEDNVTLRIWRTQ